MFVVIFDHLNPTEPYVVGPFPSHIHAEAYAATDPEIGNHGIQGQAFIVTEINAPATYTLKPSCLTDAQHRRAELEGWSVFAHSDGHLYIERIDELEVLPSDTAAYRLARRLGLKVSGMGRVLGKTKDKVNAHEAPEGCRSAESLLREAIDAWPKFDSDDDVSGTDLVEWFTLWRRRARACLDNPSPASTAQPDLARPGSA